MPTANPFSPAVAFVTPVSIAIAAAATAQPSLNRRIPALSLLRLEAFVAAVRQRMPDTLGMLLENAEQS
jgi:hypothetical protein